MKKKLTKYSPQALERAGRRVFESRDQYDSQWAAIESLAGKFSFTAETLWRWLRQQKRDTGQRSGSTTAEQERLNALEREVKQLRYAYEILRLASPYFAQAERDRRSQ